MMTEQTEQGITGSSSLLCADVEHVVASDEGVAVLVLELAVVVLLCLLQGDVHVAVQTGQHPCTGTEGATRQRKLSGARLRYRAVHGA